MNPLESLREEQRSAFLYLACAAAEKSTTRAELFRRLAGEAEAQGAIWRAQLTARGSSPPGPFEPDARTRLVARMVGWFGPRRLRGVLRQLITYMIEDPRTISAATSSGVGSRPMSCTSWRCTRMRRLMVSTMWTGIRMVRAWSARARVIAWRIHHVA